MNFLLIWQEWLVLASVAAFISLIVSLIRRHTLGRTIAWLGFYVYITIVVALTLLPFPEKQAALSWAEFRAGVDLVPIRPLMDSWSIVEIYLARGDRAPLHTFLWNNVGNLLVLMPLAVYLYTFFKQNFLRAWLYSLAASLLIELSQAFFCIYFAVLYRVIDINDLILNSLGALIALLIASLIRHQYSRKKIKNSRVSKRKRR